MNDQALIDALRLAVDPPGGLGIEALRDLTRPDESTAWDISTTAAHLRLSPHTLRYYERIGLLRVTRDSHGHRSYDAAAVRRLVFLTRMRTSGMPIATLRRYVELVDAGPETAPERARMLAEHRDELRQRIADLQLSLAATEYKISAYTEGPTP